MHHRATGMLKRMKEFSCCLYFLPTVIQCCSFFCFALLFIVSHFYIHNPMLLGKITAVKRNLAAQKTWILKKHSGLKTDSIITPLIKWSWNVLLFIGHDTLLFFYFTLQSSEGQHCVSLTLPEMPLVCRELSGSKSTLMYPSMAVSSFLVVQLVVLACSHQLPWYQPGIIHWYLLPNMFRL